MTNARRPARFLVALALFALPGAAQVEITYLGNEGVLLRSDEAAVLIDALHAPYKAYATAPPETRAKLVRGEAPYQGVDLVLVSHIHGDHFDAAMVAAHLKNNPAAALVSSDQVFEAVRAHLPLSAAGRRFEAVTPAPGSAVVRTFDEIKVKILGLPHGGRAWGEIRNLGHLIEIGGVKVLHVGDADVDPEVFAAFRLVAEKIDVALLPDWYLAYGEGQRLVREQIRPRRLFAVHVMDDSAPKVTPLILEAFPGARVLTEIGTTARIAPGRR